MPRQPILRSQDWHNDDARRQGQPNAYFGERGDWLVSLARTRDSGSIERSNFRSALRLLGGESATVVVEEYSHWAVGWIQVIVVKPTARRRLKVAREIARTMADYPLVDEDDLGELEFEEHAEHHEKHQRHCDAGECSNEDSRCEDRVRHGEPCGPEVYSVCRACHGPLTWGDAVDPFALARTQLALPGMEPAYPGDPRRDGFCSPDCYRQADDSRCDLEHGDWQETEMAA